MKVSQRYRRKVTLFQRDLGCVGQVEGSLECGSVKFPFLFPLSCTLKYVTTQLKQPASDHPCQILWITFLYLVAFNGEMHVHANTSDCNCDSLSPLFMIVPFFFLTTTLLNFPLFYSSLSVLVLVMGKEGVHGGGLNKKAYSMAKYLRIQGSNVIKLV